MKSIKDAQLMRIEQARGIGISLSEFDTYEKWALLELVGDKKIKIEKVGGRYLVLATKFELSEG